MSSVDKKRTPHLPIQATSPSEWKFHATFTGVEPWIARLVGRNAVFVIVTSSLAPYLDFCVREGAVRGYPIGQGGYHIHESKGGQDAVGSRVQRWGCRIVRSGFAEGAVTEEAA